MRGQAEAAVKVAEADIVSAEAKLAEAQAGIKRAEADLARWKSEYDRVEQLFRERAQTGSLRRRDPRTSSGPPRRPARRSTPRSRRPRPPWLRAGPVLDKARSDLVAAESGIEVARADDRRVEALLGYARIVAPYDGVVTRRHVDTGHLTVPGAQGEPLVRRGPVRPRDGRRGRPEMFAAAVDPATAP